MPEPLWDAAVELAQAEGIYPIARALADDHRSAFSGNALEQVQQALIFCLFHGPAINRFSVFFHFYGNIKEVVQGKHLVSLGFYKHLKGADG